ncbi:MAG: triose-phosphate isomerase [Lentisphaerae bacterium]|nr:triose-phosphate isomerase [Lentisphaerota bacterium]
MSRCKLIAGNWKMNMTSAEGSQLVEAIKELLPDGSDACQSGVPEVLVCPPFLTIGSVVNAARGSCVKVGAQNIHWEESGAFTGEVSASMLNEAGCTHAIIGHSERRQYFAETDETVNKRTKAAVKAGIVAVVCVGETLGERESGITNDIVERQIREGLKGLTPADMEKIVIAYEPVWAIGTGKVATDEQAQEVHAFIRVILTDMFGEATSGAIRILYGGSMKPDNAKGLLAQKDIDGGLIGGASLKATDFAAIVNAASQGK